VLGGSDLRRQTVRGADRRRRLGTGQVCPQEDQAEPEPINPPTGCHSWRTEPGDFETSILRNRRALDEIIPGTSFRTLLYPISEPRPLNKKTAGKYFRCRAGSRSPNVGTIDLNALCARFLEQYRGDPRTLKKLIDRNCRERGWLTFATHDISSTPSPFGCTPEFFEDIVRDAVQSGARVLPVVEALKMLADVPSEDDVPLGKNDSI
jgi:hypothetical protein